MGTVIPSSLRISNLQVNRVEIPGKRLFEIASTALPSSRVPTSRVPASRVPASRVPASRVAASRVAASVPKVQSFQKLIAPQAAVATAPTKAVVPSRTAQKVGPSQSRLTVATVAPAPVKNEAKSILASRSNAAASANRASLSGSVSAPQTVVPGVARRALIPAASASNNSVAKPSSATVFATEVPTAEVPTTETATSPARNFTVLQQNWLDSNSGPFANLLVNSLNRNKPYGVDPLPLQWANFSTGRTDGMYRAVGSIQKQTAQELAAVLGGQVVDSPFGTFGTQSRDTYIRMPNGQMIDASVLAENLNAARETRDPFSGLQAMIDVYQSESRQFNPASPSNAVERVIDGRFGGTPPGIPT